MSTTIRTRKHHNNKGYQSIRSNNVIRSLKRIADKLGIPFDKPVDQPMIEEEKDNGQEGFLYS